MKKLIFTAIFLIGTFGAVAQNTLNGIVQDSKTGENMLYANVALLRQSDSVFMRGGTTGTDGRFLIRDVADGTYMLRITSVGYASYTQTLEVKGDADLGTFKLMPGQTLSDVKVKAKKPLYAMDGEKNMYNVSEDVSLSSGTLSDALQNAPGVQVDAQGNITLRGSQSVEIWINDQPSHLDGEALKQYIKTLPAGTVERIEVISNPSARYGGGGAVINIVTNQKMVKNEFLSIGGSGAVTDDGNPMLRPFVSYVYANEKFSISAFGNYSYFKYPDLDNRYTEVMRNGDMLSDSISSEMTEKQTGHNLYFGFNGSYQFDKNNSLSVWFGIYPIFSSDANSGHVNWLHNPGEQDRGYSESSDFDQKYTGGYGGFWFEHKINPLGHKFSLSGSSNFTVNNTSCTNERDYNSESLDDFRYSKTKKDGDRYFSLSFDYALPFGDRDSNGTFRNELQTGISEGLSFNSGFQDYEIDGTRDATRCFDIYNTPSNTQIYATLQRRMGGFVAKLGLRGACEVLKSSYENDHSYDFTKTYLSLVPSLHLSYTTKDMHNFSLSYTRRTTNPSCTNLSRFAEYAQESYSTGNPDLKQCFTHNLELKWDKYFLKFGSVGLEAYYRGNANEIGTLTDVAYCDYFGRIVSFTQSVNMGNSHTAGLDANVMFRPTPFFNVRFGASLYDNYFNVQLRPEEWVSNEMLSYRFNINVWAKLWNMLDVFADFRYHSKQQEMFNVSQPEFTANIGASVDLFGKKMSAFVFIQDLFNSTNRDWNNSHAYYQMSTSSEFTNRWYFIGLTFRFGKLELESMTQQGNSMSSMGIK